MTELVSSPLQSFTGYLFRNAFQKHFGGVDYYYAPYIRFSGRLEIKSGYQKDLALKHNRNLIVVPQVMTNDADEFIFAAQYVQSLGYQELNWNLGCPYPMVTNKCLGSGLIADINRVDEILRRVHDETDITVSMKMRMGYEHAGEIVKLLPILDRYPLRNIGIHARIGKQLYKGGVDLDGFERCLKYTHHKVYYNGDITSVESFRKLRDRFPAITTWMIGRGLIADPFLPSMIKQDTDTYPEDRVERFGRFHEDLLRGFSEKLKGDKHVIMKMSSFWDYFSEVFTDQYRLIKKVKKTKTLVDYEKAVGHVLDAL